MGSALIALMLAMAIVPPVQALEASKAMRPLCGIPCSLGIKTPRVRRLKKEQ